MTQKKPSRDDLEKIRTEIEPNLKEIKEALEIDPEITEEMVRKSRELSKLSIENMTTPLSGRANYQCNAEKDCKTCTIPCMYMQGRYQASMLMMGKIHHPPLRMPMPNLIRKAGNQLDAETIDRIWRNLKWKEIPGSEDTDQK